ncbi:hypothetical protein F8S09_11490 [Deinococcus sp. SDU3-2]|uniref:Pilin A4 domain-containing protein n=1 Tax=Deinococcus terrestris TaxID=2651870 RepID=A0A7X1NWV8_9DEIO|nr:hypothetical protein [Deinococcus terrestris]MPY67307.1 hypothetical protein [Deinococcus terrestris]
MRTRYGWALAGALVLTGCEEATRKYDEDRATRLAGDNALYYRARCVEAIERFRVKPGPNEGTLPRTLDGQSCESPVLNEYALSAEQAELVQSSVIRLDPTRLSAYTIVIQGKDGKTYDYRDRGTAEAAAEQAGTFEDSSAGGTVPAPDLPEEEGSPEISKGDGAE